jgi:signal transduction histidine kinase
VKIKFQDIKHFIFAAVVFTLALQGHQILLKPTITKINIAEVEETLVRMENEAEELIDKAVEDIEEGNFLYVSQDSILINQSTQPFNESPHTLLIYKNDSLKYWSDNHVQAPHEYVPELFKPYKITRIANAWYEPITKEYGAYKLVALIKIKNQYEYKNKYLNNTYNKAFDIPASTDISPRPARGAVNINGKTGDIVFSLSYSKSITIISEAKGVISLLYFLSFAFLLLFFNRLFILISHKKYSILYLVLFSAAILALRWVMINYKAPYFIYALSFFEPEIYAGNKVFPFLGDFFFNAMLLLFFAQNFFRIFNLEEHIHKLNEKNPVWLYPSVFVLISLSAFFLLQIGILFETLLFNSTISFELYRLQEISVFSVSAYLIFGILIAAYLIFTDKIFKILCFVENFRKLIIPSLVSALAASVLFILFSPADYITVIFFLISVISVLSVRSFSKEYSIYTLMLLAGLAALYIVWFIAEKDLEKNKQIQKILVTQLYDERDDVAELLIKEIDSRLDNDTILSGIITNVTPTHKLEIHDYLSRKYFYGYWDKYKLSITLCGNVDIYSEANQADYCANYFKDVLKAFEQKLDNSNFYYINNSDGTITYFTSLSIPPEKDERRLTLYIQLKEKANLKKIGYPELLVDDEIKLNSIFDIYSYAKYNKGRLAARSGNYPYKLSEKSYREQLEQGNSFFKEDQYLHHINSVGDSNMIILSRKLPNILDYIIAFSYLFVFYSLCLLIAIVLVNYKFLIKKLKPDFKNKVQFAIISFLAATFILFVAGTVYYATEQDKQRRQKAMTEKIQSVLIELEHKFENEEELTPGWSSDQYDHLDELLIKFSQVFFIDINLYDTKGYLLATSRTEVFERGLLGKQMNSTAFKALAGEKKMHFLQKEKIGNFEYASIYVPFNNKNNKIIAYLHLPFFVQDKDLQNNISALLISTVNIYILFFLISVFVAVIIANSISKPLRMLQSKFKNVQLGRKHQEISYTKDDEIGDLVKEYNRMTEELQESISKLAESERESAWREMAKQIAHEIKNPLTPMKLSVQLLQHTWNNKDDNFGERLKNVSNTLIEQIDTLSAIASEFSAFAKMPKARNEEVDLVSKLQTVVQLFDNEEKTKIHLQTHNIEDVIILADKEQLSRVFINVIKNGIQSVPEGITAEIYVELTIYGNNAKVTIEDNGSGIPENKKDKLFKPSFTTKTKGMGMGLAIVKNIINNANGEIWFESEEGKGTKFFIEFPLIKD